MDWSLVDNESHPSAWPELLLPTQTFVIVQVTIFTFSGCQKWRVCHQRWRSQPVTRCRLMRSQIPKQHLAEYVRKSLPGWNWSMSIFASCLCAESQCIDGGGVFLCLLKKCFFVCSSPIIIMNASPVGFPSSLIPGLVPGVAALKIGLLHVWKTPYMETFVIGFIYAVSWRVKLRAGPLGSSGLQAGFLFST